MAKLFDIISISSQKNFDKLIESINKDRQEQHNKLIEKYRKQHIFSSYEEALNYTIENCPITIQWHDKQISWEKELSKFRSYEQEYDIDGILAFDVIKYYTKDQLLDNIKRHMENISKKYPDDNKKWWLDENNMLSYVYLLVI